jgi:hypothetical protein
MSIYASLMTFLSFVLKVIFAVTCSCFCFSLLAAENAAPLCQDIFNNRTAESSQLVLSPAETSLFAQTLIIFVLQLIYLGIFINLCYQGTFKHYTADSIDLIVAAAETSLFPQNTHIRSGPGGQRRRWRDPASFQPATFQWNPTASTSIEVGFTFPSYKITTTAPMSLDVPIICATADLLQTLPPKNDASSSPLKEADLSAQSAEADEAVLIENLQAALIDTTESLRVKLVKPAVKWVYSYRIEPNASVRAKNAKKVSASRRAPKRVSVTTDAALSDNSPNRSRTTATPLRKKGGKVIHPQRWL